MGFLALYVLGCGLGLLFLFYGSTVMDSFRIFIGKKKADCKDHGACLGVQSNYRLSFAFVIFHIAMLVCSLVTGAFSEMINEGCWLLKALCLAALFILCLMIPNEFFNVYREVSRVGSCLYLIAQVVILVDFAYSWNSKWVENYEQSNSSFWMFWLFFFSGAMWIVALTVTVLNYFWFSTTDSCGMNIALITLTLVIGILFTVLSISGWVEGSLLTSSAVNLYCVYLCWLALASEPDDLCNDWRDDKSTAIIVAFSVAVTFIVVAYVAFQTKDKVAGTEQQPAQAVTGQVLAKEDESGQTEEERDRGLVYFHALMILLSLYMAMMLTNWGAAKVTGGTAESK